MAENLEATIMQAATLIKQGLDNVAEELRLKREWEQGNAATKINDFNWAQVEKLTGGGIVTGQILPPGRGPGPRGM